MPSRAFGAPGQITMVGGKFQASPPLMNGFRRAAPVHLSATHRSLIARNSYNLPDFHFKKLPLGEMT